MIPFIARLGFQEKDIEKLPVLNEIKEEVVETITAKSVDADSLAFGNQLQTEQISSVQVSFSCKYHETNTTFEFLEVLGPHSMLFAIVIGHVLVKSLI